MLNFCLYTDLTYLVYQYHSHSIMTPSFWLTGGRIKCNITVLYHINLSAQKVQFWFLPGMWSPTYFLCLLHGLIYGFLSTVIIFCHSSIKVIFVMCKYIVILYPDCLAWDVDLWSFYRFTTDLLAASLLNAQLTNVR